VRFESFQTRGAEILLVAYGTSARICKAVVEAARTEGIRAGLLRLITLYPFPEVILKNLASRVKAILVAELSMGQFVEDVKRVVSDTVPVYFKGRVGGVVFSMEEILEKVRMIARKFIPHKRTRRT